MFKMSKSHFKLGADCVVGIFGKGRGSREKEFKKQWTTLFQPYQPTYHIDFQKVPRAAWDKGHPHPCDRLSSCHFQTAVMLTPSTLRPSFTSFGV